LDIDGVLAGWNYFKKPHLDTVDPKKIELLNSVDAKIVISSSWGEDGGKTEEVLRRNGLQLEIVGYTEHFWNNWICRGNEIVKWIDDNIKEPIDFEYCIVDDDTDMLLSQKDNFVHINERYGITEKDINKIKKILKLT
jgi:hypothetical protein